MLFLGFTHIIVGYIYIYTYHCKHQTEYGGACNVTYRKRSCFFGCSLGRPRFRFPTTSFYHQLACALIITTGCLYIASTVCLEPNSRVQCGRPHKGGRAFCGASQLARMKKTESGCLYISTAIRGKCFLKTSHLNSANSS